MKCGACGAPIADGMISCPFCGASVKYAITEAGTLPYEYTPASPRLKEPEPPEPRWDLEGPAGTSHSYQKTMRNIFERWAALERRRQVAKSSLGCILIGTIFGLFVISCSIFSLVSSETRLHNAGQTPSARDITATATANPNPYPPGKGLLTLNNLLDENSNAWWANYSSDARAQNQGCIFQNGSYTTSKSGTKFSAIKYCLASHTNFRNFAYQIEIVIVQGYSGGIIFRENTNTTAQNDYYYFYIGTGGYYGFWVNVGTQGKLLQQGTNAAIHQGNNKVNTLGAVADGRMLSLFANGILLTTFQDGTYDAGRIGTAAGTLDGEATICEFNNAKVWTW
jgi:uncharacterized Zn finger protein (UPF0148 family)